MIRALFSAGDVWMVHQEEPQLSSSVTFKVNAKHLNHSLPKTMVELPLVQR
jgi:hypothetical protein